MSRKQRGGGGKGGPSRPPPQAQQQKPQGGGGGGWSPLRDSIRRDVEQAVASLAFAERLHTRLDTQRRLFHDFPRVLEQLRSGAFERLAAALSRLYEGGQGFDLQRFLRDLPMALAQLAAAERPKAQAAAAVEASAAPSTEAAPATETAPPAETAPVTETAPAAETAPVTETAPAAETAISTPAPAAEPAKPEPVSPRLELRAKLLAAAPQLAKAAVSYRHNVATIRRAALPRRSMGPWRADREVLEEGLRAVEFAQKIYDAYAEAWADQPLPADQYDASAAEADRFLAWTQLDRYVELAVLASTNQPRPGKPGQQIVSAPREAAASVPPPAEAAPAAESAPPAEPAAPAEAAPAEAPGGEHAS